MKGLKRPSELSPFHRAAVRRVGSTVSVTEVEHVIRKERQHMKDLRKWTPACEVRELTEVEHRIDFCIGKLIADRKHSLGEEVAHGLTYEEVLGALASGKAAMKFINDSCESGY